MATGETAAKGREVGLQYRDVQLAPKWIGTLFSTPSCFSLSPFRALFLLKYLMRVPRKKCNSSRTKYTNCAFVHTDTYEPRVFCIY